MKNVSVLRLSSLPTGGQAVLTEGKTGRPKNSPYAAGTRLKEPCRSAPSGTLLLDGIN
jgi:hypothetical protein